VAGAAPLIQSLEVPEVVAQRIARRIANTGRALTALAIVLAVLLGLRDYYFDLPFGSLKDYVGLVLYGTGTKLALDLVHTSMQHFDRAPINYVAKPKARKATGPLSTLTRPEW
jgi:hypothetical protein